MSLIFKETITKEKIEKFTKKKVAELKFDEKSAYVKLETETMGPNPEFTVDDYTFEGINYTSSCDLSVKWRKFMLMQLSKNRGDEYIDNFDKYLNSLRITWADIDYNEQQFSYQNELV